ncbi:MAG: hypothetical protein AB4426_19300 [Xenococcaceae cyanobacterium]
MSGSPKYSCAELVSQVLGMLTQTRLNKAKQEEHRRREAAQRERRRRVEARKQQLKERVQVLVRQLQQQGEQLYPADLKTLQERVHSVVNSVEQADNEAQLQEVTQILPHLDREFYESLSRKRRDEEEKKRVVELEKQQFELNELERRIEFISEADSLKFDPAGRSQAQQALRAVATAIATGQPTLVPKELTRATACVTQHIETLTQRRADWERRKAAAEAEKTEMLALIAGLKEDPVVMCWHGQAVTSMETEMEVAQQAISGEQFDHIAGILASVRTKAKQLVEEANAAQLKADQRDYITDSITQTLQEMGFTVVYRKPEHPEHPASAIILGVADNSGKGISVSVPVEGEVFYDVDGYHKGTVATVGGGQAAICDEAEQVLNEMHTALNEHFGVKMSELTWSGKDPNRILRRAGELPKSDDYKKQGGMR